MNTQIAEKWIAALRSGEYAQTTEKLKDKHGFCCLGVLTDLYIKETENGKWDCDVNDNECFVENEIKAGECLASAVQNWAGIKSEDGRFDTEYFMNNSPEYFRERLGDDLSYHNSLVELNDDCGLAFPEIAIVIEIVKDTL